VHTVPGCVKPRNRRQVCSSRGFSYLGGGKENGVKGGGMGWDEMGERSGE
jgi:hypothetical protein